MYWMPRYMAVNVDHGRPSFSGMGGQDRARGRHLTAVNTLSRRFRQIQPVGAGGGGGRGAVRFHGRFNQWGKGGGGC